MQNLVLFTSNDRDSLLKARKGESKFGEHVQLIPNLNNIYDDIVNLDVDYVLFGITEDIGVYANNGKTGAYKSWEATIKVLLNTQSNSFTKAKRVLILGHLNYTEARKVVELKASKTTSSITACTLTVIVLEAEVAV